MHEDIAPESIRGEILANLGTEVDWREGRAEAWLPPIWKRNPAKWRRVAGCLLYTSISAKNTASHARLSEHNEEQDKTLQNHEGRITRLESKGD